MIGFWIVLGIAIAFNTGALVACAVLWGPIRSLVGRLEANTERIEQLQARHAALLTLQQQMHDQQRYGARGRVK